MPRTPKCKVNCRKQPVAFKTCKGEKVAFSAKVRTSPKTKKDLEARLKNLPEALRENARAWYDNGGPDKRASPRNCSKKRKTPTSAPPSPKKTKSPSAKRKADAPSGPRKSPRKAAPPKRLITQI